MSSNYTIKDIAKYANVGTTTVSRVLNDHPYVSDDKRQAVLDAIDALNYRQNLSAKWLRNSDTGMIGFLTDEVATTPYAVDIIRGAQEAASENGKVLLVLNTSDSLQSNEDAVEFLLERQVIGIIYATLFHREVHLPDNIKQVPTALANCFVGDASLPSAVPDEFIGGYRATKVLLEAGHQRIAFLNLIAPAIPARDGRLAGYKQALKEYNIPFDPELVGLSNDPARHNFDETQRLLALKDRPTAIFAGTDRIAMASYQAIRNLGMRIPEDISVVGFDNQIDVSTNLLPNLTSIQLPHYDMGNWAFHQLFIDEAHPTQVKIDCALIERDSVANLT
ncbi:MAG: LacI family DNA-binding transcriptional regulator [Phototrophicaceae bacterium]